MRIELTVSGIMAASALAACDPAQPADGPPPAPEPACTSAADRYCDQDVAVRCRWDQPDPLERVLGIEPRLVADRDDCAAQGMVCSESSGADCVAPACAGEEVFDCSDPYSLRHVRFAREPSRTDHACATGALPAEEIVVALLGPPPGEPPHRFALALRGPDAARARFLHYAGELPCETDAGCTADVGGPGATSATVEAGQLVYVAIDAAEPIARDTVFDLGVTCGQCGNGIIDDGERCDDGNLAPGDGCAPTCDTEPSWQCGAVWTGPSECVYTGSTCETAIALDRAVVAFDTGAWFTSNTSFGTCEPTNRARVIFEVAVPPGQTLRLTSDGETRITAACEDRSTCVGDTEWTNDRPDTVSVWVHAAGSPDSRGEVSLSVSGP